MAAVWVGTSYLAMLLSVVYAARRQGRQAGAGMVAGVVALMLATWAGATPESVANHLLVLVTVAIGSGVVFTLGKRKK